MGPDHVIPESVWAEFGLPKRTWGEKARALARAARSSTSGGAGTAGPGVQSYHAMKLDLVDDNGRDAIGNSLDNPICIE
jgi:hypothetical protein